MKIGLKSKNWGTLKPIKKRKLSKHEQGMVRTIDAMMKLIEKEFKDCKCKIPHWFCKCCQMWLVYSMLEEWKDLIKR